MARPGSEGKGDRAYDALARHNRLVARLRILVPIVGALVLVALVVQIWIANMGVNVNVKGITFDRGVLTIDAPHFSGTTPDGMVYDLTADEARTRLGDAAHSDLSDLRLDLRGEGDYRLRAQAKTARLTLSSQVVHVSGPMIFTDSNGTRGQLLDPVIDWPNQTLTSKRPVDMTFGNGAHIAASGVRYDGKTGRWQFDEMTLIMPGNHGKSP